MHETKDVVPRKRALDGLKTYVTLMLEETLAKCLLKGNKEKIIKQGYNTKRWVNDGLYISWYDDHKPSGRLVALPRVVYFVKNNHHID